MSWTFQRKARWIDWAARTEGTATTRRTRASVARRMSVLYRSPHASNACPFERLYPSNMFATTITLGDTDAAGVLFYPRLFELAQRSFEAFVARGGLPLDRWLDEGLLAPVVHVEADYRAPLRLGDAVTVETTVESIGDSSFRMAHVIRRADGSLAAEALVVHACIESEGRSTRVPERIRKALRAEG